MMWRMGNVSTARKPGSAAIKVGVVLMFVGALIVLFTLDNPGGVSGFAAMLAVAGLVTLILGFARRREHQVSAR